MASIVTGTSKTRLYELKKFANSGTISQRYFTSTDSSIDGVNVSLTTEGSIWIYYIGGITYTDIISNGTTTTTFSFVSEGYGDENNFSDFKYIKYFDKGKTVDKPILKNNVFIERGGFSVFEKIYRIANTRSISELNTYAGGRVFNVVENS